MPHILSFSPLNLLSMFSESYFVGSKTKGRISKRGFPENKARQIFRKTNISCPLISTCADHGVRNIRFSKNFGGLCFLETSVLRFARLPYYWQFKILSNIYDGKCLLKYLAVKRHHICLTGFESLTF